jgi:hypothetical protein
MLVRTVWKVRIGSDRTFGSNVKADLNLWTARLRPFIIVREQAKKTRLQGIEAIRVSFGLLLFLSLRRLQVGSVASPSGS